MSEHSKNEWRIEATRKWTESLVLLNGQEVPVKAVALYVAVGEPYSRLWTAVERQFLHVANLGGEALDINTFYPPVPEIPSVVELELSPHRVTFEGLPVVILHVGTRRFRVVEETPQTRSLPLPEEFWSVCQCGHGWTEHIWKTSGVSVACDGPHRMCTCECQGFVKDEDHGLFGTRGAKGESHQGL